MRFRFSAIVVAEVLPKTRFPSSGVYLLVNDGLIVYVGSSTDVEFRIWRHKTETLNRKEFDGSLWTALPGAVLAHYEGAFIRALRPRYNLGAPRHRGYDNEILEGFGLEPHDDEHAKAVSFRDEVVRGRRRVARQPDELDRSVSGRIRYWRSVRGVSKAALADTLNVTRQAVGFWENGGHSPTHANVVRIAAAFGVSLDEFLGRAVTP